MGLDMYLERMERYKNTTPHEVNVISSYLDYLRNKEKGKEVGTLKEWCDITKDELPPQDVIDYYKKLYTVTYSDWDTEHKYGYYSIMEDVGYWRKANQIHNWFVNAVQDGEDDCCYHHEVTKELLKELLSICQIIVKSCPLKKGQVHNGDTYTTEGGRIENWEDGEIMTHTKIAERLLPSSPGFFFGSTDYDQWYLSEIKETINIIKNVLKTTDFDKQAIYYVSSW